MTDLFVEIFPRNNLFSINYYDLAFVTIYKAFPLRMVGYFFLLKCSLKYVNLQHILS